ncbi:MAG: hypothetical protein ACRECR_00435, partial [Thermoplasmata archaeon]
EPVGPRPIRWWVREEEAGRVVRELHGSGAHRAVAYRASERRGTPAAAPRKEGPAAGGAP